MEGRKKTLVHREARGREEGQTEGREEGKKKYVTSAESRGQLSGECLMWSEGDAEMKRNVRREGGEKEEADGDGDWEKR